MDRTVDADPGFEALVATRRWRAEAEAWIHDRAVESGRRLSGPIDQIRVRPWSTQLVAATDRGRLWFKASCPPMRFEAGLQDLLARLVPDQVAAPLAVDATRGWLLTTDRGATLGELRTPTAQDWTDLLRSAGAMQRRLVPHREEVLATGVPDCSPATVPARLDRLLEALAALPPEHPSYLDDAARRALEGRADQVREAAEALTASPLAATVQHGDLHPQNAFADLRLFDLGDLQWAHPLEILRVPHAVVGQDPSMAWEPLLDAYLETWSDLLDRRSLRSLVEASVFTHAVNRAQTWFDAIVGATPAGVDEWGRGARLTLMHLLDV